MDCEYVESDNFKNPKIRLVSDKNGCLFVRKNVRVDSLLAERLTDISSPYIVKFIEFGEDNDGAYVIEEYVEGDTAAERSFTKKQAVKILIELCDALDTLHSAKIVHRDIKPSNIIITKDGHIKLIDFDASRIEKVVKDRDTQILGTEGFAPPEQFGFSQTDRRSDIYSFGITMNLLLGENSEPFNKIIKKCKALDPNDRYDSISKVKTAIRLAVLRRFAVIPAAALLLIVFTAVFSAVLNSRDLADHTNDSYLESYINFDSNTTQPPPIDSQPESSKDISDSSSGEIDSDNVSTSSESPSEPADSQSFATHEPSEPEPPHSQPSAVPKPPESPQPPQIPEPPQTSAPNESGQISEISNGFYKTSTSPYGYYSDVCDYYFDDDLTVYGIWDVIGAVKKEHLNDFLNGRTDLIYSGANSEVPEDPERAWVKKIQLGSDGLANVNVTFPAKWTKGYVVLDYTDRTYVCELFSATVNKKEYLLIEKKTGDYVMSGTSDAYFVYVREHDMEKPVEYPPQIDQSTGTYKITYTTSLGSEGYEDECDYFFADDPSVHGYWEVCGVINADQYDNWIAGKEKPRAINLAWIKTIGIYSDGGAIVNDFIKRIWTNGYLIDIESKTISAFFTVTVDETEYLVVENKNGDYKREGRVISYLIYSRK